MAPWTVGSRSQAGAVDARPRQCRGRIGGQRARVDLDRDLAIRLHREAGADMGQQGFEVGGCDHGRRAAAEMDVAHREAGWQSRGDQVDLPVEQVEIVGDRIVARDDLGVAAAVPAHGPAERHMEIERQALAGGQVAQPFQIVRAWTCGPKWGAVGKLV